MSDLNIFQKVYFGKRMNSDGRLVWILGRVEDPYEACTHLYTEELRQLYDVIGFELVSQFGADSEVQRLQEEARLARLAYKKLRDEITATKRLLGLENR